MLRIIAAETTATPVEHHSVVDTPIAAETGPASAKPVPRPRSSDDRVHQVREPPAVRRAVGRDRKGADSQNAWAAAHEPVERQPDSDGEQRAEHDLALVAHVSVYSGPDPPSGGVRRPPLALIAPHWTQFDGVISSVT